MKKNVSNPLSAQFCAEAEEDINQAIAEGVDPTQEYLQVLADLQPVAETASAS